MRRLLLAAPLLALAACVEVVEPPPAEPLPDIDACRATQYQGLIGQPRSILAAMTFPAGTRIIGPGDAVTMDFRVDRLNIEVGTNGRIDKIACY
ncbi:hypothetical protein GI374_04370 [Paracoccus sp. S-4012]|uniref:I78 family peptidase inhibitor n=1 Tax=Paracoccus sp. S-4012 TaxID=2665648 RepID=UPI0012B07748|nr:I78 family peptidase inhibitor [Paracoccus sp. S-4012]MRX49694.1 hypothetical protein [Paracoccus sp. S-4012]